MKRKIKKRILYFFTSIIVFFIAVYFIITSNIFLTGIVAPSIGFLIDTDFVVKYASYDPFTSSISIQDIRLGTKNNPFITSKKASLNVNLFALITNRLAFSNIKIDGIDINLIKNGEGQWSIPWIYIDYREEDLLEVILDFSDLEISNMNLNFELYGKNNKNLFSIGLHDLNLSSKYFINGILSSVRYKGNIKIKSDKKIDIDKGSIEGVFSANLDKWCIPSQINIFSHIAELKGKINNRETILDNSKFKLDIKRQNNNVNKYKINYFNFTDTSNKTSNSYLSTNGIINFNPFKLSLNIDANPIQSNILNTINSLKRYNLGKNAKLKYFGKLDFTDNYFKSSGELSIEKFIFSTGQYQLTRDMPLNFFINYDFKINNNLITLNKLNSTISDKNNKLLSASINKPFYYDLEIGKILQVSADSKIKFFTKNLDLNLLNPFLPQKLQSTNGKLSTDLTLSVASKNNNLNLSGYINLNNASLNFNENHISELNINQKINLNLAKHNRLILNNYIFELKQSNKKISKIILKGNYNIDKKKGNLDLNIPYITENIIDTVPQFNKKFPYISVFIKKLSPINLKLSNRIHFNINCLYNLFTLDNFNFTIFIPKEKTYVSFVLNNPFSLLFKGDKFFVTEDIEFKSEANSFNFKKIIDLMPKSFPVKLNNGFIKYKLLFILSKHLNSLKIKGKTELLYANINFYGRIIKNLSISNSINAVLTNTQFIKLENCITELYINGIQSFLSKTDGSISFNKKISSHLVLSVKSINKYILELFHNGLSLNVKKMMATGKIYLDYIKQDQSTLIKGGLHISEFALKNNINRKDNITGSLDFNTIAKKNNFILNSYSFSLYNKKEPLINLKASGNFPIPIDTGTSSLNINSDKLKLKKIAKIYDLLNNNIKYEDLLPKTEFPPLNFHGLDLNLNIKFSNISYGNFIKSKFNSNFAIKKNFLKSNKTDLKINNTEIVMHGNLDMNSANGYIYNFNSKFKNMNLAPIINTFIVAKNYKNTKGTVNTFIASINGKGFTEENINKHLTGKISSELSNLSIPYQIQTYKVLKIMLLPIEMLEQIRQTLPGGLLINNLNQRIKSSANIVNNLNNINLAKIEIYFTANDGQVFLKKFKLIGNKSDTAKFSEFSGIIGFNGKLDIESYSNISGLRLPFHIRGTINNPSADTTTFLAKFLAINTANILNPLNILKILIDTGIGVKNTIKGTTVLVGKAIAQPFVKEDLPSKVSYNKK